MGNLYVSRVDLRRPLMKNFNMKYDFVIIIIVRHYRAIKNISFARNLWMDSEQNWLLPSSIYLVVQNDKSM